MNVLLLRKNSKEGKKYLSGDGFDDDADFAFTTNPLYQTIEYFLINPLLKFFKILICGKTKGIWGNIQDPL